MSIFRQNKKMSKASILTFNFLLPAVSTCPGAGACAKSGFCYAMLEQLRYPSAKAYRERMLELSKGLFFGVIVSDALIDLRRKAKGKQIAIRIHTSGDFYSPTYLNKWIDIAFENPDIVFYAYTKSVWMFKKIVFMPRNLIIIYSLGGLADGQIDVTKDRHSRIFATREDALAAGYNVAASEDDTEAWAGENHRVGLVMFGSRKNKGNIALGNTTK